jgi:hypothetical protein
MPGIDRDNCSVGGRRAGICRIYAGFEDLCSYGRIGQLQALMGRGNGDPGSMTIPGLTASSRGGVAALPLIDAAIDLQAVTAAIDDIDQPLGVKLDRGRPP